MKWTQLPPLLWFGITTVLFRRMDPLVGSLILTDRCNLKCRHCAVANLTGDLYSLEQIRSDMAGLYRQGVRVLLFYGGEPFLWGDQGKTVRDLVREAKAMGFFLVNIVTNGTFSLDVPEADLLMVSLDGAKTSHDRIRGVTYEKILANIQNAPAQNICLYMAVNNLNRTDVEAVCQTAREETNIRAVAFNFHTPYPGVDDLTLTREELEDVCRRISELKKTGTPVLNLITAFPAIMDHRFKAPCPQCVIVENGRQWTCGRCSQVPGLCARCGFAFAAECSLVFRGNSRAMAELFTTYLKII